ncbi:MAG: elongation factor P--(R)-beta-lysine ligase [Pseudomonadota bacterium]
MSWQPSATIDALKNRAEILRTLRDFFYQRHITEVETPLLCKAGTTDVYLDSMTVTSNQKTRYLQTSPEFAMKRLLAAGIGDCYQICKAFRCDEAGQYHNPEFTMLEWYRLSFNHHQLMNDMDDLLQLILKCQPAKRISYQQLFLDYLNIDPHLASVEDLKKISPELCSVLNETTDTKDDYLMLLLSHLIEPKIGFDRPCFIYDYPASQAALSKVRENKFAERFEVYVNGIELANGFHELQSAQEQLERFQKDNKKRRELNKPEVPIDDHLIAALENGLPACAGVALGIDRLIMLAQKKENLYDILSFGFHNC